MGQGTFLLKINRRHSLRPCNCFGCNSDNLSHHNDSMQQCPCACTHIYMAVSQTDQPERHLSTFEEQQLHKEEVTGSSQEGLGLLLATVANETVWQNCHGELSLQVTGDPPTTDVLPAGAQARSGLCRCCASWCWSVRGSGLRGDQLGCRSVKLWGSQAVVSQVAGPWAATARLWGGQATVSPPGPGSVCNCHGGLAAGQAGFPVAEPRARAGARTHGPHPHPGVIRGPHAPAPHRSCPCRRGSASRWAPPRSRRTPGT